MGLIDSLASAFGSPTSVGGGISNPFSLSSDTPTASTLDNYQNILTLKDLGISYEDVILKFIEQGLLPKNF